MRFKFKIGDYIKVIEPVGYILSDEKFKRMVKDRIAKIVRIEKERIEKEFSYPYMVEYLDDRLNKTFDIYNNLADREFRLATEDEIMAEMI